MAETKEKNIEIKGQIHELDINVNHYWQVLNQEGVWLFLATLGGWSVDNIYLQYFAAVTIFLIFAHRVYVRAKENGFFSAQIKEIKSRITSELEEDSDSYKARVYDLKVIEDKLSSVNSIKNTWVYIVCSAFFIVSVADWCGAFSA